MRCLGNKNWTAEVAFMDYVQRASDEALDKFEVFYLRRSVEMQQTLRITHPDRQWIEVKLAIITNEVEHRDAISECTAFFRLPWYKRLFRDVPESYEYVYEEVAA